MYVFIYIFFIIMHICTVQCFDLNFKSMGNIKIDIFIFLFFNVSVFGCISQILDVFPPFHPFHPGTYSFYRVQVGR